MKKRASFLFAMAAVLLAVSLCGGACAAAEGGSRDYSAFYNFERILEGIR